MSAVEGVPPRAGMSVAAMVALAATMIGLSFVMARVTYDAGSNPLTLILLRYPVVALLLWSLIRLRSGSVALERHDRLTSYGVGLAHFIGTGCYLASIVYLPVSLAVLVFYTYPLMTVIFESLLRRGLPRPFELLAFLTAFAGLALALEVSFAGLDPRGIAFALVGALGASTSFVWSGRALSHVSTTVVTFHMAICGCVVAAILVFAFGAFALPSGTTLGWVALATTILCFAVAFVGMFTGVRLIGALRTSMIMNLEPIATIALAIFLLGERLTGQQVIGAILVIGAVVATQVRVRQAVPG